MLRTANNNELNIKNVNETVKIAGWVENIRDHGGVLFLDLRDNTDTIQVVSKEQKPADYPDMSVFPAWFELPDASVKNRVTPTPVPMITKETKVQ